MSLYCEQLYPNNNLTVISSDGSGRIRHQQQSPNTSADAAAHGRSHPSVANNDPIQELVLDSIFDDELEQHRTSAPPQSFINATGVRNPTIIILPCYCSSSRAVDMNAPPPSYEEATAANTHL